MIELNRKILLIFASLFIVSMMLTPLAIAKPGAEKNNDKFEFFKLVCSGMGEGVYERVWSTPPEADVSKTAHLRGGSWITGDTVQLTVGDDVFDLDSEPYSVDWTTTFDANLVYNNDGTQKLTIIILNDIVTLYEDGQAIGTLVLNLKSTIDFSTMPPGYSGTMQGYGTGALKGVHISGIDLGLTMPGLTDDDPPVSDPIKNIFERMGTITGWPEQITNIIS